MNLALTKVDKTILGLAIPALGSLAIDPLLTLVDTAFIARLGTNQLAALGVDTAILTFAFFASTFLHRSSPLWSHGHSAKVRKMRHGGGWAMPYC